MDYDHQKQRYQNNKDALDIIQSNEPARKPVLILVSRIKQGKGGVASYFRSLDQEITEYAQYLSIGGVRAGGSMLLMPFRIMKDWLALCRALKSDQVKVVHVNPSLLWKAIVREGLHILLAKAAGKKALVFWHGWDWECAHRLRGPLLKRLFLSVYGRADCHLVLAEQFRDYLHDIGLNTPIICESTVVNSETLEVTSRFNPADNEPIKLLFLSRLQKEKGIYVAIEATELLNKSGLAAHLIVAGDGEERKKAEEYVRNNAIQGITFLGYVRGKEKERVLSESDIYIFPSSHGEGMPLSVLDAMAAGLPVLCTRAGGLDNFFEDGKMGFSVSEPSAAELTKLIQKLISNPEQHQSIRDFNKDYARRHFQSPVVTKRLTRIYQYILDDRSYEQVPPDWMNNDGYPETEEQDRRITGTSP